MLGSNIRLQVEPPEGAAYTVAISLKTAIAFEREFKTTLSGAFSQDPSIEHIAWLAWTATKEQGRVVKLFDEWVADLKDITLVDDTPDPLVEEVPPMQSQG